MSGRADLENVRGVLCDLDGVLYVGDTLLPGAVDAIRALEARGIRRRFVTNTTTRTRRSLLRKLTGLGLPIEESELHTALSAAAAYVSARPGVRVRLVLPEDAKAEFSGIPEDSERPDAVVIGDIGDGWTFALMNELFRAVMGGAEIVACHRGRYFETEEGLRLDVGAFVAGLEYATGRAATIVGKPSVPFFRLAAESLGVPVEEIVMVGDDIDSDVGGAQAAGIRGVLVQTGKYRAETAERSPVRPDAILASVAELPDLLG